MGLTLSSVVSSDRKTTVPKRTASSSSRIVSGRHFEKDPSVIGKTVRLGSFGDRSATIIGVLEPPFLSPETPKSSPTSPPAPSPFRHHGHRPSPSHDRALWPSRSRVSSRAARAELRSVYGAMTKQHLEAYSPKADSGSGQAASRPDHSGARTLLLVLLAAQAWSSSSRVPTSQPDSHAGGFAAKASWRSVRRSRKHRRVCAACCWLKAFCCAAPAPRSGSVSGATDRGHLGPLRSRFSVRALDLTVDTSMSGWERRWPSSLR